MFTRLVNRIIRVVTQGVLILNKSFNQWERGSKRIAVFVFGAGTAVICTMMIVQALLNHRHYQQDTQGEIVMPYDIFMNEEGSVSENQLTPVGKMKGEINGEFESFYVAVDVQGSVFINRDIEYAESAYEKSNGWKQISRDELMEYEKHLHFIPSRSRGIKR